MEIHLFVSVAHSSVAHSCAFYLPTPPNERTVHALMEYFATQHLPLHPAVEALQISGIRQMAQRVASHRRPVLSLTLGQPDYPTPPHIVEAAVRAAYAGHTSYTPNAGLPALRNAVAAYVRQKYALIYDGQTEVIVTTGASQALDMALRTILTPGCEVIIPTPIYPGYAPLIRLCGAVPVAIDVTAQQFTLTASLIEQALTPRTRCVILTSPANPTGVTVSYAELQRISTVLKQRAVYVLSDEIYSELCYDEPHTSIAAFPAMRERTIVINGLSKSHAMTGWRIGFAFAPAPLVAEMLKVLQYSVTCACSISQHAALAAMTAGIDDALPMRAQYAKRREYVYAQLREAHIDVVKPDGAFYMFPSIQSFGLDSNTFAYRLLDAYDVAVVPGNAFGPQGEGYIRLSYACADETLHEALHRIKQFVKTLS